jgi:DNA polymerase elongation subunit (family B)
MSKGPKILTFDVETSPIQAWVWGLWDQNIGIDFVSKEANGKPIDWTILSYAAKWGNDRKVLFRHSGGRGAKKVRDDYKLVKELRELLDEADIVVAQNGKRFDVRKVNARMIQHGIAPPSPYAVVDTMVVAKKYFAFTSQKLKWTSTILGVAQKDDHKKYPGFELWERCLLDNPGAWKEMEKYNKQDVRATWEVYLKMRPWIDNHPNRGLYAPSETPMCPKCGSGNMSKEGIRVTVGGSYHQHRCRDCGGWARGKTLLQPLAQRKKMLVN